MTKLSIVIPIFNEAKTLKELLNKVAGQNVFNLPKELILVESNSTDGSRKIAQSFFENRNLYAASQVEVKLVLQEMPRGKGHAVREGLSAITGDIVLIQDSDLEYDVGDYPLVVAPILEGKTDFVLGSRHLSAGSWRIRKFESNPFKSLLLNFGGILFHGFFNILFGVRLTDPTTMYKVFRRHCIQGLSFECNRFDFDFELLGKLIRAGYVPLEVPITYKSRGFEEGKKVRIIRDPLTWIVAILKARFSNLRSSTLGENPQLDSKYEGAPSAEKTTDAPA